VLQAQRAVQDVTQL